jgi:ligand-binding SRPBCC domain-containing protein
MKYLCFEQTLPITPEEAWSFFSTPKNLNLLTPPDIHFKILNDVPDRMYWGAMIVYEIKFFLNIKFIWVTEITAVDDGNYFIDEQRKGPYRIWHHEHHFTKTEGGVLMTDKLYYDIGKSVLGGLAGKLFVHKKVAGIFEYRRKRLEELFGKK